MILGMNRTFYFFIIFSLAFSFRNDFIIVSELENHSIVSLEPAISVIDAVDGFSRIVEEGDAHTAELGMPELTSFTTYFKIDPQKEYKYELEVVDSYIIEDIKILPYQGNSEKWDIDKID